MLSSLIFILAASVGSLVAQEPSTGSSLKLQLEAIQAHFSNAALIPDALDEFQPSALLNVSFASTGQIQPGQNLTVDQVKPMPNLTVQAIDPLTAFTGNYTVIMADADVVGANQAEGQTRHWLANNCYIFNNTIIFDNSTNITDYQSPFPAEGSGAHRYVVLVYAQSTDFHPDGDFATPGQPVGTMDLNDYIENSGLGPLLAGNYFTVQQGIATVNVSVTSPVMTATLPDASPTSSTTTAPLTSRTHDPIATNDATAMFPTLTLYLSLAAIGIMTFSCPLVALACI